MLSSPPLYGSWPQPLLPSASVESLTAKVLLSLSFSRLYIEAQLALKSIVTAVLLDYRPDAALKLVGLQAQPMACKIFVVHDLDELVCGILSPCLSVMSWSCGLNGSSLFQDAHCLLPSPALSLVPRRHQHSQSDGRLDHAQCKPDITHQQHGMRLWCRLILKGCVSVVFIVMSCHVACSVNS